MTYQEIKLKHSDAYNKILDDCGTFWAFSNDRFQEGIKKLKEFNKLKEGEKVTNIGAGGFMPSKNIDKFTKLIKEANKTKTRELKEAREAKTEAILYELNNYECFYTGDTTEVIEIFKGIYSITDIKKVYKANYQDANL